MSVLRWLAQSFAQHSRFRHAVRKTVNQRRPARLSVTLLEDRLAPALLTVNSLADAPVSAADSALTLREAVALINSGGTAVDSSGHNLAAAKASQINTVTPFGSNDVIQFAPNLIGSAPQQIVLQAGELVLDLSATITGPGASLLAINGNNQSAVFEVEAATVGISGLTIEGGVTSGSAGGGGVYNNGTLTLTNTIVSDNTAAQGNGGGIANDGTLTLVNSKVSGNKALNDGGLDNDGSLTLIDSSVSGNTAVSGNGGLANYAGSMALIDSTVSGNTATGAGGLGNYDNGTTLLLNSTISGNSAGFAGGLYNTAAMTLMNSTVSDNVANSDIGGILNSGTMALTDSTVADNAATNNGGLDNNGTLTLTGTTVSDNTAQVGNGGLGNYGGTLTLVESTVSGNTATGAGGLGNYDNGTTLLLNSTISGNSANFAGGIFNTASMTLMDSTVSDNVASGAGGGIINSAALNLTDSTIADNTANLAGALGNYGGTVTLVNSTVDGNTAEFAGGIVNGGVLNVTGSNVAGNTASVWNGGIVSQGGTLLLVDSNVPGLTDASSGDNGNTSTPALAINSVADNATSGSLVHTDAVNLAVENADIFHTGVLTLPGNISSGASIPTASSSGDTDAQTIAGSSTAVTPAEGTANTGALLLNVSAIAGSVTVVGDDGSLEAGDPLPPSDSAVTIGSSSPGDNGGETTIQAPVSSAHPAERLTDAVALKLADGTVSDHAVRSSQVAALVSAESNAEADRLKPFVLLSGDSSLDQDAGSHAELMMGNVAALLLLIPWFPNQGNPSAESEELLKRNKNWV